MAITDQLLQIANALRIVPLGNTKPDVGVPLSFGFAPAVPVSLEILQAGDVSALWFTKDIRFADALGAPVSTDLSTYLTDTNRVIGGQPLVDPGLTASLPLPASLGGVITLPKLTNTVTNPPTPPANDLAAGTPGVLGKLTGAVPIPIAVPVSVTVTWSVTKSGVPATPGIDFVAPKGLTGSILDLVFLANEIRELTQDPTPPVRFEISATVEVQALGQTSGPVPVPKPPLPPIVLDVPAILRLPTVLALFRHKDYATQEGDEPGTVLLVVPQNAVLRSANELAPVLDTLRGTITRVQSFKADATSGNFATLLLGLGTLIDALNGQPMYQFVVGDIRELFKVHFSEQGWRIFPPRIGGDLHAEDKTSAMILIGMKGKGVKLWGDPFFSDTGGDKVSCEVFVGDGMWATIRDFVFTDKTDVVMFPPGTVMDNVVNRNHFDFNDRISSLQFIIRS